MCCELRRSFFLYLFLKINRFVAIPSSLTHSTFFFYYLQIPQSTSNSDTSVVLSRYGHVKSKMTSVTPRQTRLLKERVQTLNVFLVKLAVMRIFLNRFHCVQK
jgi:hypothetical protein